MRFREKNFSTVIGLESNRRLQSRVSSAYNLQVQFRTLHLYTEIFHVASALKLDASFEEPLDHKSEKCYHIVVVCRMVVRGDQVFT